MSTKFQYICVDCGNIINSEKVIYLCDNCKEHNTDTFIKINI